MCAVENTGIFRNFIMVGLLTVFIVSTNACGQDVNAVTISYENIRHAFFRGEEVALTIKVVNNSGEDIEDAKLVVDICGLINQEAQLGWIKNGGKAENLFRIDTLLLKSGKYSVECQVRSGDKILAEAAYPFRVARRWNPDRMRVWHWAHNKFGRKVYRLDEEAKKQLGWYADKGFNSFIPGGGVGYKQNYGGFTKGKFELFDYCLVNGWETGFAASGGFAEDINGPGTKYKSRRYAKTNKVLTNPFHPEVARSQNQSNRKIMEVIRQFPGVKTCFFNSEVEDDLLADTPMAKQKLDEAYGPTVKHKFIAPGVIADNDEGYVKWLYRYKWGEGLVIANERAARMVHSYRPDIDVFSDPLRRTTVYDRYKGMDLISTWTYTNPDPKMMLFIETLIANGRPFGQGVMQTVTMLNYAGSIAPKEKGWTLMGPDRLVETSWINLSRSPDALSVYIGSGCDPFNPEFPQGKTAPANEKTAQSYPYQTYPESFEAFKVFNEQVVKPYGPVIRKLDRTPRKVAVLSSESSRVYSASPNLVGYYANYQIYSFYSLLNMIHIPADVVFDETIADYGLDGYDVLVLPMCDTLTKTVYDKISAFQARGGLVVSDQYLRAEIPGVIKFDFDFTYRSKVSANAILENKDYAEKADTVGERRAKLKNVKGVTALDDQKIMESYAEHLRKGLEGKINREVDCSSSTALLNMLEKDGAKYLFIINDKRTYGDRFGEYKAMLEKAVPQKVTVTLNDWKHEKLFLYDIIGKKILPYAKESSSYSFDVNLPAPGGRIIVMLSEELGSVEIFAPREIKDRGLRHKIDVLIRNDKGGLLSGVQPVKLWITDPAGGVSEFSDYCAAESGVLSIDFVAGLNDTAGTWTIEAEELMTGKCKKVSFELL